MKFSLRNLLIITFLYLTFNTFAQTEKGAWMVGGSLGANSGRNDNYTIFNAFINPDAGYFFSKNLVIGTGLTLSYGYSTTDFSVTSNSNFRYHIITFGLNPFVRYYFGEKKLKPFTQLKLAYSHYSESTVPTGSTEITNNGFTSYATAGIGLAYFIAPNVSLDATLDYQLFRSNADYVFNNQPDFRVGFQIFLPKK